jgi:DNA-binding PadR family transcriptional regulator
VAEGRPARRYFELTADGAETLAELLKKHRTFQAVSLDQFGIRAPHPAKRRS